MEYLQHGGPLSLWMVWRQACSCMRRQRSASAARALQLALDADVARCALLPQLASRQQQLQPCHHPCQRGLSRHACTHDRC